MADTTRLFITCLPALALSTLAGCQSQVRQLAFDTPSDAQAALRYSSETTDKGYGRELFGPEVDLLLTGDPDVDAFEKAQFAAAMKRHHELKRMPDGSYEVLVGEANIPFPVPLVQTDDGKWMFDTPEGVERLTDLRVGIHELRTIQALQAIYLAQQEYASVDRDGDGILEYAQWILSTDGTQDGLYWDTADDEPNSPLGSFYVSGEVPLSPSQGYHGYFYMILTSPAFSEESWFDEAGNLVGGYAVLAYPAVYDETGIMTFVMGPDGHIHERDFGPTDTATVGVSIDSFLIDDEWWSIEEYDVTLDPAE